MPGQHEAMKTSEDATSKLDDSHRHSSGNPPSTDTNHKILLVVSKREGERGRGFAISKL